MALVGVGIQVIPLMGAAVLLPSAMATALRLHAPSERRTETDREALDAIFAFMNSEDSPRMMIGLRKELGEDGIPKRLATERGEFDNDDGEDDDYVPDVTENEERNLPSRHDGSTEAPRQRPVGSLDTWSVVWYCGMFAAFTSLFLIMPCSQVLCKAGIAAARRDPRLRPRPPLLAPSSGMHYGTPPPPYKQFAPPPYESLFASSQAPSPHLEKLGVYIIPLRDDSERRLQSPAVDSPPPPYSETQTPVNAAPVTVGVAAITVPTHPGLVPSVA